MRIHRLLEQIDKIEPWPDAPTMLQTSGKFEMGLWTDYVAPALHEFTFAASARGALQSPFETCYFEFSGDEGSFFRTLGCLSLIEEGRLYVRTYLELAEDSWGRFAGTVFLEDGEVHLAQDQHGEPVEAEHLTKALLLVASAISAIQSKTSTVRRVEAPEALNRARAKKGRAPLPDYHVVTLDGAERVASGNLTGGHASKRMHWRRGHFRRMASGLVVSVSPSLVGGEDRGFVDHHYRVAPSQPKA